MEEVSFEEWFEGEKRRLFVPDRHLFATETVEEKKEWISSGSVVATWIEIENTVFSPCVWR